MRRRTTTAILSLALLVGAASPARAEPTGDETDRARIFFNAGAQAYAGAKYADAVRSFEQAYALAPRPTVLFSLAQAERKSFLDRGDAGTLQRAIAHYREYLDKVPSGGRRSEATEAKNELEARLARLDPKEAAAAAATEKRKPRVTVFSATPGAQVSIDGGAPSELPYFGDLEPGKHKVRVFGEGYFDAEQEISGDKSVDVPVNLPLREKPALVTITLGTDAEVYIDGRLVAETPLNRPIEVASGPHVIAIAKNGRKPWSQEVVLERAKPITVEPKLQTSGQRVLAFSMLGTGGAAMAFGAFAGLLSLGAQARARELERQATRQNLSPKELNEHNKSIEDRDASRTAALGFLGVGAAITLGGALFYVLDRPPIALLPPRTVEPTPKPATPDLAVVPIVGPGVYGAGLGATF